ncbi:MAG TPA: hypothetical protein VHS26_03945 [Solirubrobacteraceae bacterium]|jgi:hypothetical protein|nr:hypothetical protein [Solirubrobacteraceae bacterium]
MSLSLAIAINAIADISLLAGLAYVMSRAARLTPHVAAVETTAAEQQPVSQRQPRSTRASRQTARTGAPVASHANA